MLDDLELLAAWRSGDRTTGGQLFDRHFPAIRRFFRTKVGDDYEELVQRTFTGCVEGQSRFRAEGKFRSYLFATARRADRARAVLLRADDLGRDGRGPRQAPWDGA